MIYFDASALLKLLFEETDSAALALWMSEREGNPKISSEIVRVEVIRSTRRLDDGMLPAARVLVSQLDLIPLSSGLMNDAADAGEPLLRSLDAIHLASALSIGSDLTGFIAYDYRLVLAAEAAGIAVTQPRDSGATTDR